MAKFKRKRNPNRQSVYYNRYRSTWSPDEREASLVPGTEQYNQRQADALRDSFSGRFDTESSTQTNDQKDTELLEEFEEEIKTDIPEQGKEVVEATVTHEVYDVGKRKYRRRMQKEAQIGEVRKIAEGALGESIPIHNTFKVPGHRSMDDELQDDSVSPEAFKKDVLRDYESDLKEIMKQDNDHDGDIDEDDITPGMRKMLKYM